MAETSPNPSVPRALSNLGEILTDLVGIADDEGRILYLNRAGRKMVGIGDEEDISDRHIHHFYPDWSVGALIRDGKLDALSNVSLSREATLCTRHGQRIPTMLSVVAHLSSDYKVDHFSLVARDVSSERQIDKEWKAIEKRLMDSCRMETIGRLTVGMAHNLDHTLGDVSSRIGEAIDNIPIDDESRKVLQEAIKDVDCARQIVQQIMAAGSPKSAFHHPVEIQPVVREAVELVRASLPDTITLREDLQDDSSSVAVEPVRVHEIVLNLVLNASDALKHTGGVLEIKLDSIGVGGDLGTNGRPPRARKYARNTVTDNGPGLAPETVSSLFDSRASTEDLPGSPRLALSVVNGIVESCGGAVTVHNRIGRGTSFYVFLPAAEPPPLPTFERANSDGAARLGFQTRPQSGSQRAHPQRMHKMKSAVVVERSHARVLSPESPRPRSRVPSPTP